MADFHIASLKMNVTNAQGHEHRLGPIAGQAAQLFASRAGERWQQLRPQELGTIETEPVSVDLNVTADHEAAESVANAWLDALAARLED